MIKALLHATLHRVSDYDNDNDNDANSNL